MKHILLILLTALLFGSCMRDAVEGNPVVSDGETMVKLSIRTPAAYNPTRAADTDYRVEEVAILVFEKSGSDYLFGYMAQGTQLAVEGQTTIFVANLIATPDPIKLLVVANHTIDPETISKGANENDVRKQMTTTFSNDAEVIPMYGEVRLDAGLGASNHNLEVMMLRSFARVSINVDLEPGTPSFELTHFYVFRANDLVQVVPDLSSMSSIIPPDVKAASVPFSATSGDPYVIVGNNQAYISENLPLTDPDLQITDATCLVVGGIFDGDLVPTHYRIDFNGVDELLQRQPFGQVMRNNDYQFTIKSVSARGWVDANDAANNISSSIVADLVPWNNMVSQLYVGDPMGIYAMLQQNEVVLRSSPGSMATLEFTTNSDFEFGFPLAVTPRLPGELGQNAYDEDLETQAYISKVDDHGDYKIYTMTFVAPLLNDTGLTREHEFYFHVDQWILKVRVYQLSTDDDAPPVVNIMSVGTNFGSFGGPGNDPSIYNDALKEMLQNPAYFGPASSYVSSIQGFNFLYSEEVTFENDNNLATLKLQLPTADVLILPYTLTPTANAAIEIKRWLEATPNRVLIMMCDNASTNAEVRALLDPTLVWEDYDLSLLLELLLERLGSILDGSTITGDCMVEAYNQDNAFILQNGPFGPVDNTTYFSGHDATSQFVDNPPANYVKLVDFAVRSGYVLTGYEYAPMNNCMYLGVDPDRRIIYVGDSQFTHTILDNIDSGGAIDGSPMNTLWLNIWAWIAQTVVAL